MVNGKNIAVFLYFDQINAALVSTRDFFQKHFKILTFLNI